MVLCNWKAAEGVLACGAPQHQPIGCGQGRSALTIEQVVSRLRCSHLQLIDLLLEDLREADALPPASALSELAALAPVQQAYCKTSTRHALAAVHKSCP